MALIIRTVSKQGDVEKVKRINKPNAVIGRSFDADLIVSEPHVSEKHIRISRSGDQLFVEDLGSLNGTKVNGDRIEELTQIHPGDELQVGKMHFQIFRPGDAVPTTQLLNPIERFIDLASNWWLMILSLLIVTSLSFLEFNWGLYQEVDNSVLFRTFIGIAVVLFVWPIIWSFIAKVVRGDAHLKQFVGLTLFYSAFSAVLVWPIIWFKANWPNSQLAEFFFDFFDLAILGVLIFCHIYLAFKLKQKTRKWVAYVGTFLLAVFMVYEHIDTTESHMPQYDAVMITPDLLVTEPSDIQVVVEDWPEISLGDEN